ESDLIAYAAFKQFPIIPCNLCGSQENLKRQEVGRMIREWDRRHPGRSWNMFNALSRIVPSHLMDRDLFDFAGLKPTGVPAAGGATAFDHIDPSEPATPHGGAGEGCADNEPALTEQKVMFERR